MFRLFISWIYPIVRSIIISINILIEKLVYISGASNRRQSLCRRGICGCCGPVYGRKVWNSTDDRLRRIIWRCNGKYVIKGEKGCGSRHIDDGVLYQAFVGAFNVMVENKESFMGKWQERLEK